MTRRLLAAVCKIGFYQTQFLPCQTLLRSDAWTTLPSTPFPFISLPFGNTNQMFLLMYQRYFTSRLAFEGQMFHNCEHEHTFLKHKPFFIVNVSKIQVSECFIIASMSTPPGKSPRNRYIGNLGGLTDCRQANRFKHDNNHSHMIIIDTHTS